MAAFTDPMLDSAADLLLCTCSGAELEFKFADGTTLQALVTEGVDKHEGTVLMGVFAKDSKLVHFSVDRSVHGLKFSWPGECGKLQELYFFEVYDSSARDMFGNGMLLTTSGATTRPL